MRDTLGGGNGALVPKSLGDWPVNRIAQKTTANGEKAIDIDYPAAPYSGSDTVLLSDVPFERQRSDELTYKSSSGSPRRSSACTLRMAQGS